MWDILADCYQPLFAKHSFTPTETAGDFNPVGKCWKPAPEIGAGSYWIYSRQDLFDVKIHDFYFHEDSFLEFELPSCLSITQYGSISGEELSPYHRLSASCIKTFIGGGGPYPVLIHKNIPIRAVGIEIMPAYYEDRLRARYPDDPQSLRSAFRQIDLVNGFPEMARLLQQIRDYRGDGIAASLFYEAKVAEAVSLVVEAQQMQRGTENRLSRQDIAALETVAAYLNDHFASNVPLERLSAIACMGTTKLKGTFKQFHHCTITDYIQQRRMEHAEYLLANTDLTIGQVAQAVGYSTSSRFAELFRKSTGLLPREYRKTVCRR